VVELTRNYRGPSIILPPFTKDCLSRIQILSTKDCLFRFPIQLYLYLSPPLLLLVLRALSTFTLFLNSRAQLLKRQTFLDGGSMLYYDFISK
jgi:hypothetical protein